MELQKNEHFISDQQRRDIGFVTISRHPMSQSKVSYASVHGISTWGTVSLCVTHSAEIAWPVSGIPAWDNPGAHPFSPTRRSLSPVADCRSRRARLWRKTPWLLFCSRPGCFWGICICKIHRGHCRGRLRSILHLSAETNNIRNHCISNSTYTYTIYTAK